MFLPSLSLADFSPGSDSPPILSEGRALECKAMLMGGALSDIKLLAIAGVLSTSPFTLLGN